MVIGISVLPGFDICFVQFNTMGGFVAPPQFRLAISGMARGEALHAPRQQAMYLYCLTLRVRTALELMPCRSRV
jgi:hypothetical protein